MSWFDVVILDRHYINAQNRRDEEKKITERSIFILPYLNSTDTASLGFNSPALFLSLSLSLILNIFLEQSKTAKDKGKFYNNLH